MYLIRELPHVANDSHEVAEFLLHRRLDVGDLPVYNSLDDSQRGNLELLSSVQ